MIPYVPFPKIPRLSRDCVVTEKIDGTAAQINIRPRISVEEALAGADTGFEPGVDVQIDLPDGGVGYMRFGSKNRWLKIVSGTDDNFGFASWGYWNAHELAALGVGSHWGEWWGQGIQRGYGLDHKRFSLFNVGRWYDIEETDLLVDSDAAPCPPCCCTVPILYNGLFTRPGIFSRLLGVLARSGSIAAPGFKAPEGIIIFHTASQSYFKKTIERDEEPT